MSQQFEHPLNLPVNAAYGPWAGEATGSWICVLKNGDVLEFTKGAGWMPVHNSSVVAKELLRVAAGNVKSVATTSQTSQVDLIAKNALEVIEEDCDTLGWKETIDVFEAVAKVVAAKLEWLKDGGR